MVVGMKTRLLFLSMVLSVSFSNLQPMLQTLTAGMRNLKLTVWAPTWDCEQFARDLEVQDYQNCYHLLDYFLKVGKTYQLKWIEQQAALGHVPLLYLLVKDYWLKTGSGARSLSSAHLEEALCVMMVCLIRVKQDIACCTSMGESPDTIYTFLKAKFWYWYGDILTNHFVDPKALEKQKTAEHKELMTNVLKRVGAWFDKKEFSKIHPAWLRTWNPRWTWGVDFDTKNLAAVRETADRLKVIPLFAEARTTIYGEEIKHLQKCETFLKFFEDVSPKDLKAIAEAKSPELAPQPGLGDFDDEEALELGNSVVDGKSVAPVKRPQTPPSHLEGEGEASREGVTTPPAKQAQAKPVEHKKAEGAKDQAGQKGEAGAVAQTAPPAKDGVAKPEEKKPVAPPVKDAIAKAAVAKPATNGKAALG